MQACSRATIQCPGPPLRCGHEPALPVPHVRQADRPQRQREHVRGALLHWVDHEAAIYAVLQLGNERVVTKYMSEIDFLSSAWLGDLLELELVPTRFGKTALTLSCHVRNMITRASIITIDRVVMVGLGDDGHAVEHGHTAATTGLERVPTWHAGGRLPLVGRTPPAETP